jgi:hypothetical protein
MVSYDEAIRRNAQLRKGGVPNVCGGTGIGEFAFAGQPGFGRTLTAFGAPAPLASPAHGTLTSW